MSLTPRFSLRTMILAVAIAAVVMRWPIAVVAAPFLLGPSMFGGWLGGRGMRDRVVEGSLVGGAAWFGGLGMIWLIGACAAQGPGMLIPGLLLVLPLLCIIGMGCGIVAAMAMSLIQNRRLRRLDFRDWGPFRSYYAPTEDSDSRTSSG